MENITIKVHPPWNARGTPIITPRDGPPMANSDRQLLAIGAGPPGRGEPGKCLPDQQAGRNTGEGRVMFELDFNLTCPALKTTFFNTQNSVYSQWYARRGMKIND